MPLRVVVRLRDRQVLNGFTPAFDPQDGSIWLTAAPESPAGTMLPLERVAVLVLESNDGRPVALPNSTPPPDPSQAVSIGLANGDRLFGRKKAEVPGLGIWIQPAGLSFTRAFVPAGAGAVVQEEAEAVLQGVEDNGWDFASEATGRIVRDVTPTDGAEVPTIPPEPMGPDENSVETLPPNGLPKSRRSTIEAPPAPGRGSLRPSPRPNTSENTEEMPLIDPSSKTEPDLQRPDLDD